MAIVRNKKATPEQAAAIAAFGASAESRPEQAPAAAPAVEPAARRAAPPAARKQGNAKMNYYADADQQGRIRAAFYAGRDKYGWRTMTDMQLAWAMANVEALEAEFNGGEPFDPVPPGAIPAGRPIE